MLLPVDRSRTTRACAMFWQRVGAHPGAGDRGVIAVITDGNGADCDQRDRLSGECGGDIYRVLSECPFKRDCPEAS